MPGWYESAKEWVRNGELVLLGVVQEQHGERAQLFARWKEFDFPILHDPINTLACAAVPITIAIDERGIVRHLRATPDWVRDHFLGESTRGVSGEATAPDDHQLSKTENGTEPPAETNSRPDIEALRRAAEQSKQAADHRRLGDALMLWQPTEVTRAIEAYQRALTMDDTPELHFRLGVAYRRRSEQPSRKLNDFTSAVQEWSTALRMSPNQYIWRRRIQQYGPRLEKPYPFYDWVPEAMAALEKRHGKPTKPLRVPLSGAEIADPRANLNDEEVTTESPDPNNRIHRDLGQMVTITPTIVSAAQRGYRLHLRFAVSEAAVWNNEAEPLLVWFADADNVQAHQRRLRHPLAIQSAESDEDRLLDVEFSKKTDAEAEIRGFALYYICEKATQQCKLLRQDFAIPVKIKESSN